MLPRLVSNSDSLISASQVAETEGMCYHDWILGSALKGPIYTFQMS